MKFIFWIILLESMGFLLGSLTQANISPWYENLHKSSLTPPGYVFSIVWPLLYALLAGVAWILSRPDKIHSKLITTLFILQLLMNWAWTPLFFQLHWFRVSAIWLISLTCINVILVIKTKTTHKTIAWLLTPYTLWLMFASYLNGVIALIN